MSGNYGGGWQAGGCCGTAVAETFLNFKKQALTALALLAIDG
jgi:hypothetical protein